MKAMLSLLLLAFCGVLVVGQDKDSMDGDWMPTKATMGGQELPADIMKTIILTVKGETYSVALGGEKQKGTLKFDTTKTPKRVRIESKEGPESGKTFSCIYELKKDEMTICYQEGDEYPKEFKSPEGTQTLLITYKRNK